MRLRNVLFLALMCLFRPIFSDPPKHQVYDCFLFYNELELLHVRFAEMYDKVDWFVLVESRETFRGKEKPLFFKENEQLYSQYLDKVIHVVAPLFRTSDPWKRETFQRNQIMRGLVGCSDNDIIMISDLDEIVRSDAVDTIENYLFQFPDRYPYIYCEQPLYRFYLNLRDYAYWCGTVATTFAYLKKFTPHGMREFKGKTRVDSAGNVYHPRLEDAGWHFSYMGGAERCVQKLGAYSHPEYDRFGPHQWKAIKDFFCIKCGLVEIDETFPKFIRENIPYFEQAGFIWKE